MARLFVDLDGVLADFDAGAAAALGMTFDEYRQLHGEAETWRALERTPDFYLNLPWMAGGEDLWAAVNDGSTWIGPVPMVLTGLPLGTWAEPQKREWCRIHLGEAVPVICCMSRDKYLYCCSGDILIDDRESARLAWVDAGGSFITHCDCGSSLDELAVLLEA